MSIPVETKRAVVLEMATWLEGRKFRATLPDGTDVELARQLSGAWAEGYRRAIFELRWAARVPEPVPDDIRELEP